MIKKQWDEKHVLEFGKKHWGKTLAVIADMDPDYVVWLREKAQQPISDKLYEECRTQCALQDGEMDEEFLY